MALPLPLSEPEPSVVAPSLKVTLPVGEAPEPVTVAVNVTDCAGALGLSDDATAVLLAFWLTVCVSAEDVLAAKLLSPP
jgi:hypothetical protein